MEPRKVGLSREFLFHPGETLREVLEDRDMPQNELAIRTGFSGKHISEVLNGLAPITAKFAAKLECALGLEARFWMNLQTGYDIELRKIEEIESITEEEFNIAKTLKSIAQYMQKINIISDTTEKHELILALRKTLGVGNLTSIPKLTIKAEFRTATTNRIEPHILYAWIKLCEIQAGKININTNLDSEKLRNHLPKIKKTMFDNPAKIQEKLTSYFADCGIKFIIVKHFTGAPVQGFIEKNKNNEIILCMTLRQAWADIFWFTLFHEIAHILNGDIREKFIDFIGTKNEVEESADLFARDSLLNPVNYSKFIKKGKFYRADICDFASKEGVRPFIVVGRLQKEKHIPHNRFNDYRNRYIWAE